MRLVSRFGYAANQIRRDRPLTHEELMHHVPGIFGEDKHTSRSQNYTYIPTITVLESLQREGFQQRQDISENDFCGNESIFIFLCVCFLLWK